MEIEEITSTEFIQVFKFGWSEISIKDYVNSIEDIDNIKKAENQND